MMEIPGIGTVTKDEKSGWYYSKPIPVAVLDGQMCRIVVEGYDEDLKKEDFHAPIKNFLSIGQSALREAERHVFQYYQDCGKDRDPDDGDFLSIESPSDVWNHVTLGTEPIVTRRAYGDRGIYISVECECDWEQEHGLQIVFKNGLAVNKIGPFDGHCTNSDAYGDKRLEDVIYHALYGNT